MDVSSNLIIEDRVAPNFLPVYVGAAGDGFGSLASSVGGTNNYSPEFGVACLGGMDIQGDPVQVDFGL